MPKRGCLAVYLFIMYVMTRWVFLWREAQDLDAEIWEFRKVLLEKSQQLKDYRTVLLQPIQVDGNAGVGSRVNDILDQVEDCCLALRQT